MCSLRRECLVKVKGKSLIGWAEPPTRCKVYTMEKTVSVGARNTELVLER